MESTRKKQKELTLSEKIQVLELLQRQKISQMELAKRFGVTQPVISRLIKNKEKVLMEWQNSTNPDRKRKREGRDSDVDAALLQWFQIARAQHILVSDEVLAVKAKSLADALQIRNFVPTVGWISRWKARHSAFLQQGHGESDSSGQPASGGTSDIVVPPEGMTEEEFHQYVEQAAIKVCVWDITDHEVTTDMKGIAKIEDVDGEEEKSMPVFKMARGSNGRPTPFSNQFNMPDGRSSASRRDLCVETPGSSYSQPGPSGYQSYTFSRWVTPELEREGKSSRFTALSQPSKSFEDLEKAEARLLRDVSLSPSCVRVPLASSPRPVSRDDLLFLQQQQGGIPRYGTSGHEREISSEEQELILENQRKFGMYLDEKRESLKRLHALEEELLRAKIEVEQIKAARLRALSV